MAMPRKPRIRGQDPPDSTRLDRRTWLASWKQRAVSLLPRNAPLDVKVRLREEVTEALVPYGPDDSYQEISDLVTLIARRARQRLIDAENEQRGARRKAELLRHGDWVLERLLDQCPQRLTGIPESPKRQRVLETLRPALHATLRETLTGDESLADLTARVLERVQAWQAEQERRTRRRILTGAAGAAAGTAAAAAAMARFPAVRRTVSRRLRSGLALLAELGPTLLADLGPTLLTAWSSTVQPAPPFSPGQNTPPPAREESRDAGES